MKLPFVKSDTKPESPQFPTVDVASAKAIVASRKRKGRKPAKGE